MKFNLANHTDSVNCVAISNDDRYAVTGSSDNTCKGKNNNKFIYILIN